MPAFYKELVYKTKLKLVGGMLSKPQSKPMVFIGAGSSNELCKTIAQFGIRKLLVVTDGPLRELGILDDALATLAGAGVRATVFDGVLPDPTAQLVNEGLGVLRKEGCDSVLAIGGGSSIDCAKVIALAAANDCSAEDCIGANKCKLPTVPFFAIPTTAGTGSEGTCIAVISDNETHDKGGVIDNSMIPKATALDPVLMRGLPPHITAATGMDALTHAIESYIGTIGNAETDFYGLASAKLVFQQLPEACRNGDNLEARQAMALASYYGGLAITQALVGYVHAISHNLGARYGMPHGLGNAMVLPHVLDLLKTDAAKKMAEIAVHVGIGEVGETDQNLANKLVERVWALNREIGIPGTTDLVKEDDLDELVAASLAEGSGYPTPRYFEEDECKSVLKQIKA